MVTLYNPEPVLLKNKGGISLKSRSSYHKARNCSVYV